jgi:phage N-6-adenine-methyltransferase
MTSTLTITETMTATEARYCIDEIKGHVGKARAMLLDLYERGGWRALGYENWHTCVAAEFGQGQSYLYYQLQAAKIERNISTVVENEESIPERHLRPLAQLQPAQQAEAWQRAVETAPEGKVTAAHVQAVVDEIVDKPHVAFNSGNNEWYTPSEYIAAARWVLGDIDLDPASSVIANQTVGAKQYFTAEDDGLLQEWRGRVWMNPPYASELIGRFADKLAAHFAGGDVSEAVVLVNNATETGWFQVMLEQASAVCFVKRRIRFIDMAGNPSGAPLQGQAILYLGKNVSTFARAFAGFGAVLYG